MGGNHPRVDQFFTKNKVQKKTNTGVHIDLSVSLPISGLITSAGDWRDNRISIDDKYMLAKINNPAQDHKKSYGI